MIEFFPFVRFSKKNLKTLIVETKLISKIQNCKLDSRILVEMAATMILTAAPKYVLLHLMWREENRRLFLFDLLLAAW